MPARRFSVTLDVRHHGDSHGTITEVVEADSAQAAEDKLVAQATEMLPAHRTVHPLITVEETWHSVLSASDVGATDTDADLSAERDRRDAEGR